MSSLHLINKSNFTSNSLKNCLELTGENDALLLLEDGVYGALKANELLADHLISTYVIDIDLNARGLNKPQLHSHINIVSYTEFVALSCQFKNCVNWS
jgi:tRNA 2-thiouridine synthesizing protein B